MLITVQIPSSLCAESGGVRELEVPAADVQEALHELERFQPGLYRSVCDETGSLRKHMNLFINDALLPRDGGLRSKLNEGDVLFIMTAVSGG